jgi:chemotaxis protein CheX
MTARYALPSRLDLPAAAPLAEDLRARAGADLLLDADELTHLGTPGLQVLLAAGQSWRAAGHDLRVEGLSDAVAGQVALFGLTPADLGAAPIPTDEE